MEPEEDGILLAPERKKDRAILRQGEAQRSSGLAHQDRLEARGTPERRIERKRELARREAKRRTHRIPGMSMANGIAEVKRLT